MTDLIPRDAAIAVLAHDRIRMNVSGTEFRVISTQDHIDAIRAIPAIDPAAIREAALREAVKSLRDWQHSLIQHLHPETAITVGMSADVVEDLIGEKK